MRDCSSQLSPRADSSADQREQIVAIGLVGAGEKRQAPVMLDDPVVVVGKPEFVQRHVERAARRHQQDGDVQMPGGLRCIALGFFFGHCRSLELPPAPQTTWLSPRRLMRTSRWMLTFISRPNPSITVTIALPPYEISGSGTPTTGMRPITIAVLMNT